MYEELQQWIDESRRIVFFGGAGVSTESGIPDFRSQDGLYHQQFAYPPEEILSHTFFARHPEEFYRFYRAKMLPLDAQPNDAFYREKCDFIIENNGDLDALYRDTDALYSQLIK